MGDGSIRVVEIGSFAVMLVNKVRIGMACGGMFAGRTNVVVGRRLYTPVGIETMGIMGRMHGVKCTI